MRFIIDRRQFLDDQRIFAEDLRPLGALTITARCDECKGDVVAVLPRDISKGADDMAVASRLGEHAILAHGAGPFDHFDSFDSIDKFSTIITLCRSRADCLVDSAA